MVATLLLCIDYCILTVYLSPITKSAGQQVTDSQLIGVEAFIDKRDENIEFIEGGINVFRIKDAIYGRSKQFHNLYYWPNSLIPPHFNYTYSQYFGNNYEKPVYLVISSLFRIIYPKSIPDYPKKWKFNQTDFIKLENDTSVSRVYSNHVVDIYLLNPN